MSTFMFISIVIIPLLPGAAARSGAIFSKGNPVKAG
jgi:hypothetical protein